MGNSVFQLLLLLKDPVRQKMGSLWTKFGGNTLTRKVCWCLWWKTMWLKSAVTYPTRMLRMPLKSCVCVAMSLPQYSTTSCCNTACTTLCACAGKDTTILYLLNWRWLVICSSMFHNLGRIIQELQWSEEWWWPKILQYESLTCLSMDLGWLFGMVVYESLNWELNLCDLNTDLEFWSIKQVMDLCRLYRFV